MSRWSARLALSLLLTGCGPQTVAGVRCTADTTCPSGLACEGGICRPPGTLDAFEGSSDGGSDGPSDAPGGGVIPPGAVMWLRLDDPPGDGVMDSAGAHTTSCTACPVVVAGKVGSAYQFTADRLLVTAAPNLEPGTAFSVGAWMRIDTANSATVVPMCKASAVGGSDCSYGFLISATRIPTFYTSGNSINGSTALPLGTWHHLAITWDGATKRGYYDGVQAVMATVATVASDPATPLSIGERNTTSPFPIPGSLDEVVFYNRALTPAEVQQLATP